MKLEFNKTFALISILTFIIGIVLFFVSTGFVRNYLGDVLVVIFLYSLLSSFLDVRPVYKAVVIFVIALAIELLQLFLSVSENAAQQLILGSSFDPWDIIAYIIGLALIVGVNKKSRVNGIK